ncbi:hypothetical protein CFIO01_07086 [Colletotrichum fioriniae PJ7]|uniref:Uncharacterized protein n=1 Tax=Colletotrichum fioriniae PJ7 TaxID=1445577 RepID=A0A010QFD1_9PEZI|nr:hypothetical protein CFIO01_07086 [Colletotrichum fioriniae PJ7]
MLPVRQSERRQGTRPWVLYTELIKTPPPSVQHMSPNPSKRMVHRKSASPRFFALVKNILMPGSFRVFRRELSCKPPQLVELRPLCLLASATFAGRIIQCGPDLVGVCLFRDYLDRQTAVIRTIFVMWQVPALPPASQSSSFSHLSPPSLCISHNSTRRWDAQHLVQITAPFFCLHGADFYEAQLRAETKQFRHRSRVPHLLLHAFMFFARLRVMTSRIIREPFSSSPDSLAAASHVPNVCLIALRTD